MCGIAGIIRQKGEVELDEIKSLTNRLSHRGPDDDGFWNAGPAAIGHRRLAIIDLVSGKQPITNEDGTLWITFNGEIFNYQTVREELDKKGHKFRTNSDTEVIVHAYEEWGVDSVKHLRGQFAFGIVDQKKQELFLARDHLGIKPIVYYADSQQFVFASEIQAIKNHPGLKFSLDLGALDLYLYLQYIPAPHTIYQEVRKLPPGSWLKVRYNGQLEGPTKYWEMKFNPDESKTGEEWLAGLDEVLHDSVKAHIIADVPLGAFLSGGIDSSLIVSYMAQILDKPVKTFNISFSENEFDEAPFASQVSKYWKTDHHIETVRPDALSLLPELVQHYGEPFGDSSAIPTYYVSREARKEVTVALSGDGGDEFFAGYETYKLWMRMLGKDMNGLSKLLGRRKVLNEDVETWLGLIAYMPLPLRMSLWKSGVFHDLNVKPEVFAREFEKASALDSVKKVQHLDINTYLPFDILTKVDVASMMNSLEVRTPLVDWQVAEYAATIPTKFNFRRSGDGWGGKVLLKQLLGRHFDMEFINRPKKGFSVPLDKWFAVGGELYGHLQERLLNPQAKINQLFEPQAVRSIVEGPSSGNKWQLLFLEEWLAQNNII